MLETYLTIFRTVNNSVSVGDDGATPAMRLGFTREPLRHEDILWLAQVVPRPKRERRKGRRWGCAAQRKWCHRKGVEGGLGKSATVGFD